MKRSFLRGKIYLNLEINLFAMIIEKIYKVVPIMYLVVTCFWSCSEKKSEEILKKSPNILIILADDMGYGDLSSFNPESKISTPNIDALAEYGMKFTNAHAAGTWCVPSRYGLLTGQFPFRNNRNYTESMISPDRITIGKFLQQNGYQTACVGKWHQGFLNEKNPVQGARLEGGPLDKGFDYFFGIPASLDIPPYYYIENDRFETFPSDSISDNYSEGWSPIQGAFWRGGKMPPNFEHKNVLATLTNKVNTYLEDYKREENSDPFFMYFAMTAPHTPWLPEEDFIGKSKAGMYGDFVMQVDYYVGSVMKKLEDLGLSENTIVMFASDNGPVWYPNNVTEFGHNSVGPLSGMKGDVLEGGHRMPFIVRWPGQVTPNTSNSGLLCYTDIFATIADMLGKDLPSDVGEDSFSFYDKLTGKKGNDRPPVIHSNGGLLSIIHDDWKYINGKGPGGFTNGIIGEFPDILSRDEYEGQLYLLSEDIGERENRYAQNPEKVKELSNMLEKYLKNPTRSLESLSDR
jgi:arylsulfatase A